MSAAISKYQSVRAKRRMVVNGRYPRCWYCGITLTSKTMTVDHMDPKAHGGCKGVMNMVPCCFACNQAKGDLPYQEYVRSIAA